MEPLATAVIGLGRWGRCYCRTLEQLADCRLAAVADTDARRLQDVKSLARYSQTSVLLEDPDIKAVIIATPEATHFSLACTALSAGKDVLVEKPMAHSAKDAQTLATMAAARGRILAVGHTSVYSAGFARMLGTPCDHPAAMIAERTSAGMPDAEPSPQSVLWDLAPHDIAMAVLLAGRPVAARLLPEHGPSVKYEVRFRCTTTLTGTVAWRTPGIRDFRRYEPGRVTRSDEPLNGTVPFADLPLTRQCADFIRSCRTRTEPLSNGPLGLTVTRVLCTLARSRGQWVPVAPFETE